MVIAVGDRIPDASFQVMGDDGPEMLTTQDVFEGKTVVLFGVPGAFTPTCDGNHLPGFIENSEAIRAASVDTIACLSVNDVHVMRAWSKASGADGKILFLADPHCEFTNEIGLAFDEPTPILGVRSKRYAMIVKDRIITYLGVEDIRTNVSESGAAAILEALSDA